MPLPHPHRPWTAAFAWALCAFGATVLRAGGADASPAHSPSLDDVAHAPTTLTIAGVDVTVLLVCNQKTTGLSGQAVSPSRRPRPVTTCWATLQIEGTGTQAPPTLTPVGVWLSDGSVNGQPNLFTSSLTISTVAAIEAVDHDAYRRKPFVVGVADAAGLLHLVKVDGWMQLPAPAPP